VTASGISDAALVSSQPLVILSVPMAGSLISRRSAGGWALLLFVLIWNGIEHIHTLDFVLSWWGISLGRLLTFVLGHSGMFQIALTFLGLAWIYRATRQQAEPGRELTNDKWLSQAILGFKQERVSSAVSDLYLSLQHLGPTSMLKVQAVHVSGSAKTPWSVR